jgi:hypothetical protein
LASSSSTAPQQPYRNLCRARIVHDDCDSERGAGRHFADRPCAATRSKPALFQCARDRHGAASKRASDSRHREMGPAGGAAAIKPAAKWQARLRTSPRRKPYATALSSSA